MSDEIKEILDKPKILMLSYGNYISLDDFVKLKDYITNLQEENERLIAKNLELETLCDKYEEEHSTRLIEQVFDKTMYEDYKSRCEKAIVYINTHYLNANEPELLNILNGGDKE